MATITKTPFTTTSRRRSQQATPMQLYQAIADTAGSLRKYNDVPRLRFQAVLAFMLLVMCLAAYLAINLFMESRIGLAGREILDTKRAIREARLVNEDLQTQISTVLSANSLRERALAMGFIDADPATIEYIAVKGYDGTPAIDLSNKEMIAGTNTLRPEYTQSLISWIDEQFTQASRPLPQE